MLPMQSIQNISLIDSGIFETVPTLTTEIIGII